MGFRTCVIECFRVLAYYRATKWYLSWLCFLLYRIGFRLSVQAPFFQFYLHCWAITNCTSSGCRVAPLARCWSAGGVWERAAKQENRTRTCHWNQQSGSSSRPSTWDVGAHNTHTHTHKSPASSSRTKTILPVWTLSSAPPTNLLRRAVELFFATRQRARIFSL